MLKARPLSDLLSHSLDPSIESAMYGTSVSERRRTSDEDSSQLTAHSLFTKTGSLLAQASNPSDQRRSRVIAALAASIWSSSDSIDSAEDEVDATKGSDYICVPLENGRLFIQDVTCDGTDTGVASEGLLLAFQGTPDAQFGLLRLLAKSIKGHLEAEFAKLVE